MGHKWIEHRGKRILYVDHCGLRGESLSKAVEEVTRVVVASPTKVLVLYNFVGAVADPGVMATMKEQGRIIEPNTAKSAALGITGVRSVLLRAYAAFTGSSPTPFEDEAAALDWLVE